MFARDFENAQAGCTSCMHGVCEVVYNYKHAVLSLCFFIKTYLLTLGSRMLKVLT